ncbi:LOW QUALITY PROTEIN: uncharacterized protein ACR2FA_003884 [Aphomia sociella]
MSLSLQIPSARSAYRYEILLRPIRIRILVFIQITRNVRCQDGFSDQDILRLQAMSSNEGQIETITSYSTNVLQRDPNSQSISSVSVQYHMGDPNMNEEYNRADRARSRKVYHIKDPFQSQDSEMHEVNTETHDSGTGASNQYAAMQYSLPPEEFLQQMRENQYYQQQQHLSTPAPNTGYTATPQPSYQYSTVSPNYDNNQVSNQISQQEHKMSHNPTYYQNSNSYQYGSNSYLDNVQSTPSSVSSHLSTALPNNQFLGTQSSAYISSSSPIYLSSPPNLQHYVSSPLSSVQTGTSDYSNRVSTVGGNSYNQFTKKLSNNPYDNSGLRYPINVQQQYQNEHSSSTPIPSSSPYSDSVQNSWHNPTNVEVNTLSKSLSDMSLSQYQNYPYNNNQNNQQDSDKFESGETHHNGNVPSANTMFLNVVPPEYQLNNLRSRSRENEQETGQSSIYSHGDYGWKLNKKPSENYASGNFGRYQFPLQSSPSSAVSQISFHIDTSKPSYDTSKSAAENYEAQEFAKAAAKAHERQQQQQQQQQLYGNNFQTNYNNNILSTVTPGPLYGNTDKQRNKYENPNLYNYNNFQTDLITASPYYFANSRENNFDIKTKQPFDHDKALKNIVPIDVSNVVPNSDSQSKSVTGIDNNNNRLNILNYGKDNQLEQNLKQYYRSVTDAYYKDKNSIYGFNIKTKPEDLITNENKQLDLNAFYSKQQQSQEPTYNQGNILDNKRYLDVPSINYNTPSNNNFQENSQLSLIQQQSLQQRPLNQIGTDVTNILKLNDIPYRFSTGIPDNEALRLHNNNYDQAVLPTPLPMRINQNVGSHQLDVATNILNKLILNKQPAVKLNRPELDSQPGGVLSTINGFKVANPFNVDLKLVAEMLKGKPVVDETQSLPLRDQFSKTVPLKLDLSQLQQLLLKGDSNNYVPLNEGLSAYASPYFDIYNSGRFPYQGVKYSRSQEEEESIIPIADSSNNHPIGAVIEQMDDISSEREVSASDTTAHGDQMKNFEDRPKNTFNSGHRLSHRHPNSLVSGRHSYQRKYPKLDIDEPYPLLKPPPQTRNRGGRSKYDKQSRRRRVNKPKVVRVFKSEPLFEAGADVEEEDTQVSTLLRPPNPIAEAKVGLVKDEEEA